MTPTEQRPPSFGSAIEPAVSVATVALGDTTGMTAGREVEEAKRVDVNVYARARGVREEATWRSASTWAPRSLTR
jgi:hypothetical protein